MRMWRMSVKFNWLERLTKRNRKVPGSILNETCRRRDQGLLFIEAALLIPVALAFLLGVAEVGNWYLQGLRLSNLAQNLATGVQQSPSLSNYDMYRLTVSSSSLPEANKSGGGGDSTGRLPTGNL